MIQMATARRVTDRALREAGEAALAGRTAEASAAFEWMAEAGNAVAAASLAELSAFAGDWGRVVRNAGILIAEPTAVYAANVFEDMVHLLGRAGHEGEPWAHISEAAQHALDELEVSGTCEHGRQSLGAILKSLAAYAEREGAPPLPLTQVVAVTSPTMVERFFEAPEAMDFDQAVAAARGLVGRGDNDRVWEILVSRLGSWWPVDDAQVAPVVLLIDPALRQLATPERCAMVLATPRGPSVAGG
jgi:hypothetical protein